MKKQLTLLLTLMLLILTSCISEEYDMTNRNLTPSGDSPAMRRIINPDSEVRGVWIASVYNIDYPSRTDLGAEELKNELDAILDTCEKNGLNTIFFQVRPSCDALYESELFPVSEYISSEGKLVLDPLGYLVKAAHQRNIYVHAWVNPLRVTMSSHDVSSLDDKSPAKIHPEWTVAYDDGKLYLNAGIPEVCDLVCDGVREIVENYDVDGVVFDDYFYPYPVYGDDGKIARFDDEAEYLKYGAGFDDIADWRRDNINNIIEAVYHTVHDTDPECVFGVSPFAIWQNNNGKNGGSDTNGLEAYNSLYCDALAWIEGGYIDYISPQIYWTFDNANSAYDVVLRWWNTALDGSGINLYVSHAAYRYEDGNWDSPEGQLSEQISYARSERAYRGSIFYGYDEINRNIHGASDELVSAFSDEIIYMEIQSNSAEVTVTSPPSGTTLDTGKSYIIGSSDPFYPLTVNGEKVGRTKSGMFSLYVTLEPGENRFVFEQNGKSYEYVLVYSNITAREQTEENPLSLVKLTIADTYPTNEVATPSDSIYVSCLAPTDSSVRVSIGGAETELNENKVGEYAKGGYTYTTYDGYAALPEADDGEITDCGRIKYTLNHPDGVVEAEGVRVRAMGKDSFLCVRVINDSTELKISEYSSYYNDYTMQSKGMTDLAYKLENGFYKLRMAGYVSSSDVEEIDLIEDELSEITSAKVTDTGKTTEFALGCRDKPAYNGSVDENNRFVVTFYNIDGDTCPEVELGENPILKSCEVVRLKNKVRYSFELYAKENFYGFDLYYTEGVVVVSLKNPTRIDFDSDKPLDGVNIVLDAGHGGEETGAAGALPGVDEKDLNLAVTLAAAEKLEELGAEVTLTRDSDKTVGIYTRVEMLEELKPDLCVSIHQNSLAYSSDITRVRGTLALWCMDSGEMLAGALGEAVSSSLGRGYQGSRFQLLAMCRNPKFPQALIEVGFMTCVEECEQLLSPNGVEKAAQGICDGIMLYFARQANYAV